MVCSHKSGRCAVELYHASHLWYPPLYTPLPWLPVLSNIEPPALRRKAATDKLVEKIVKHDNWPIQPDILSPPLLRLTSRKPLCPCGETQTMSHIIESCPLTKLNGGLSRLHSADEDAVSWLTSYDSWNAYKKKNHGLSDLSGGHIYNSPAIRLLHDFLQGINTSVHCKSHAAYRSYDACSRNCTVET